MGNLKSNKMRWGIGLVLVFCVATFTHFYRINNTYTFLGDEARDALVVKKMIDTRMPVLLGPQTSIGNMYLGPLYYYFMTPALLLSNMDPVGPAIMVGLFGIATSVLLFIYSHQKFGLLGAIVAGLVYALNPVMIHYSRGSWNPNLVPFFSLLLLYVYESKNKWSWVFFGLLTGVIFQLHYVALIASVLLGIAKLRSSKEKILSITMALIGFFISSSPFWLFEIRHYYVNSLALVTFLKETGTGNGVESSSYLSRVFANIGLVIKGIVGSSSIMIRPLPNYIYYIAGILFLVILPFVIEGGLLWYIILGTILGVSILKESINVHYISHLFPIISLGFAALVVQSKYLIKYTSIALLLYLFIISLPTLKFNLQEIDSSQTFKARAVAAYIIKEAAGRPYNVVGTSGTDITSVEYFLATSSSRPSSDVADLIFDICEAKLCPQSDETSTTLFGAGPTHPSIGEYLGHPAQNEFSFKRRIIKNEQVSHDMFIATIVLTSATELIE